MHRLLNLIAILLALFVTNVTATVQIDEMVLDRAIQPTPESNSGFRNALETNPVQMTQAIFPMTAQGFVQAGNQSNSDVLAQGNTSSEVDKNTDTLPMLIAVFGLIIFIVRRRSGN